MSNIRDEMPLLARHEGEWVGTYTLIDNEGTILDKHNSHLYCQFPEDGTYPYYQINKYQWPDGKSEEHLFPATYQDKKIWFDTDRLLGYAWEANDSIIILSFTYKSMPELYLHEMIHISADGNHRARTMHWFKNSQIYRRTLMKEERLR